jgi:hypothetical protein
MFKPDRGREKLADNTAFLVACPMHGAHNFPQRICDVAVQPFPSSVRIEEVMALRTEPRFLNFPFLNSALI